MADSDLPSSSAIVDRGSVSFGITQPGIKHTCRQVEGEDEVLGDDLGGLVALSAEPPHPRLEEEVGRHRGGQLLGVDGRGGLLLLLLWIKFNLAKFLI